MRASSSFLWICVAVAAGACGERRGAPPEPTGGAVPAAGSASAPDPGAASPAPDKPGPATGAPVAATAAPTCTRGDDIGYFEPAPGGDAAIACLVHGKQRDCWRIDPTGGARGLAPAAWPAADAGIVESEGVTSVDVDGVRVRVPAPLQVKILAGASDEDPQTIEVCNGAACKRVKLRRQQAIELRSLHELRVLADGRTLFAGIGMGNVGTLAIDRYDLDKPTAAPQRLEHPKQCGLVLDVLAGNLLVQTTDCANPDGPRVLMTPAGKLLGNLGEFAVFQRYHALGGGRWLFERAIGFAVFDATTGKRVAATKADEDPSGRSIAVVGGAILALDPDGKITGYDASLQPKALGAIPRCP